MLLRIVITIIRRIGSKIRSLISVRIKVLLRSVSSLDTSLYKKRVKDFNTIIEAKKISIL